jgi:hypothetical protein
MSYGIALQSIIPMRTEPREQAEMVSQLMFGESYKVMTEEDRWLKILTQFDHCVGWIDRKLFVEISESYYKAFSEQVPRVLDALLMNIQLAETPPLSILAGSTLPGYNKKKGLLTIEHREFQIRWTFGDTHTKGLKTIPEITRMFMNAPYLWGGRTVFGCDCSGFVQSVYKIIGFALERDSSQQVNQGMTVSSLTEARQGDLAFFANEEGKVSHVGLILSPNEIVHCSGYVRKDKLDETGIYNRETHRHTHHLIAIRRIEA